MKYPMLKEQYTRELIRLIEAEISNQLSVKLVDQESIQVDRVAAHQVPLLLKRDTTINIPEDLKDLGPLFIALRVI